MKEKKKYLIDYCTGNGNKELEGTLEEAMKIAEEGIAFTQQAIYILEYIDGKWEEVALLPWYDDVPKEDDIVKIAYGDFGFYSDWVLYSTLD